MESTKGRKESTKSEGRKLCKVKMKTFQDLDRPIPSPEQPYNRKRLLKRNSEHFLQRKMIIDKKRTSNFELKLVPYNMLEDAEDVMTVFSSASDYNRKNTLGSRKDDRPRSPIVKMYLAEVQRFYTNAFLSIWTGLKSDISKIVLHFEKDSVELLEQREVNNLKLGIKRVSHHTLTNHRATDSSTTS